MAPALPSPDSSSSKRLVSASAFNFSLGSKSTKKPRTSVTTGVPRPTDGHNLPRSEAKEPAFSEDDGSRSTKSVLDKGSERSEWSSSGRRGVSDLSSAKSPAIEWPVQDGRNMADLRTSPVNLGSSSSTASIRQPPRFLSPSIPRGNRPTLGSSSLVPLSLRALPAAQPYNSRSGTKGKDFTPVTAPFERVIKREPLEDEKKMSLVRLGETRLSDKMTEDIIMRKKVVVAEEDEGVGVSPRGKRVTNWPSARAMPSSVQLANLLSSAKASQTLFYTSLQNALFPASRLAGRKRPDDDFQSSHLTAGQYIHQSAATILYPVEAIGQVHGTLFFWCDIHPQFSPTQERPEPKRVLAVLQPWAWDGPRLGVDPQLMRSRMLEGTGKRWLVGVWAANPIDMTMSGDISGKALMVTRYLIAEQDVT
ncbi:hypothetical protein L198_07088 [Cryptococcus wingfieldii CBS 7118]|uniref:Uncharacterized protein n=1 Tax=Cryptococcus wingfieldii CBS 7118 TaxID=1295528 RepID=A0A1E3IGM5_9TREE|nr:hypothetical protein L198_07088 [Cryptococcus wingfieldii CBS 7118]ODN87086.1 hypothetical protein L198_07088 [Cryptococcus wingfieldii CBS 7118]